MNMEDRTNPGKKEDNYGDLFLSFFMGCAAIAGIWYLSGVLQSLIRLMS